MINDSIIVKADIKHQEKGSQLAKTAPPPKNKTNKKKTTWQESEVPILAMLFGQQVRNSQ